MTITETLILIKAVQARIGELSSLRSEVSGTKFYHSQDKTVTPAYDVKAVDRRIAELRQFLFRADAAVKQMNAKTNVEVEGDVGELLRPIE